MVMNGGDGVRCLGLVLKSIQVEGCVHEPLQLHKMSLLVACGGCSCRLSAGIPEKNTCKYKCKCMFSFIQSDLQMRSYMHYYMAYMHYQHMIIGYKYCCMNA